MCYWKEQRTVTIHHSQSMSDFGDKGVYIYKQIFLKIEGII